jgi:glucose/arabinose dehydrogenase
MQRRVIFLFAFLLLAIGCIAAFITPTRNVQAEVYSPGFEDSDLGIGFPLPISLDFLPDGRMVVIGQGGALRVYTGTYAANNSFTQLSSYSFPTTILCNFEERGLTGLAIDPDYATNNYIYLFYTRKINGGQPCAAAPGNVNAFHRVSRFTLDPVTSQFNAASEFVLLDNIPTKMGTHVSGDLRFGQDGMLYITVGDNSCDFNDITKCGIENTNPQRLDNLLGKMLRINKDRSIPADNPLANNGGAVRCANPDGAESLPLLFALWY